MGKPRCSSIARTPRPAFTYANTRRLPPHLSQANTSKSNVLFSNSAQSTRGLLSFIRSFLTAASLPALASSAGGNSSDAFEKAMGHHFNDKDDRAMEYESNGSNYRTWRLDDSPLYGGSGLYLSTKIDHIRGSNEDDHIIVMVGYSAAGAPVQGQAAVQMKNENSIVTPVITQNQDGSIDIASAVANAVQSQLKSDYGKDGSNSGRQNIPHVIEKNINAMSSSVAVQQSK